MTVSPPGMVNSCELLFGPLSNEMALASTDKHSLGLLTVAGRFRGRHLLYNVMSLFRASVPILRRSGARAIPRFSRNLSSESSAIEKKATEAESGGLTVQPIREVTEADVISGAPSALISHPT